ncbi:hypothetical protein GN244_ATG20997 [Phytophthora infestans]|uniref:Uncharacterized protein n=1 Tax=Phytophthora infestans TaxID=4787 RepID=A0A833S5A5_PHYIN|nr:hypothetical protein GN244_ATG20997 [Phytophthora infestans]
MAIRESIQASKQDHVKNLRKVLDEMHRSVAQFDIGDVLYADVWQHAVNCVPAQVTGTVSNWIFVIENLITGQGREAHASRLKVLRRQFFELKGTLWTRCLMRATTRRQSAMELMCAGGLSNKEDSLRSSRHAATRRSVAVRAFVRNNHKQSEVGALGKALRIK